MITIMPHDPHMQKRIELDTQFQELLLLEQEQRVAWLRAWMDRMGLQNANQAAPHLCLKRTSVEAMVYDQATRRPISDQTLKIAYLLEKHAARHG